MFFIWSIWGPGMEIWQNVEAITDGPSVKTPRCCGSFWWWIWSCHICTRTKETLQHIQSNHHKVSLRSPSWKKWNEITPKSSRSEITSVNPFRPFIVLPVFWGAQKCTLFPTAHFPHTWSRDFLPHRELQSSNLATSRLETLDSKPSRDTGWKTRSLVPGLFLVEQQTLPMKTGENRNWEWVSWNLNTTLKKVIIHPKHHLTRWARILRALESRPLPRIEGSNTMPRM